MALHELLLLQLTSTKQLNLLLGTIHTSWALDLKSGQHVIMLTAAVLHCCREATARQCQEKSSWQG